MTTDYVSFRIEAGDPVRARFHPAREPLPEFVHVWIGGELQLWGSPEVVIVTLCEALLSACESITASVDNGTNDGGVVARVNAAAAALVQEV